MTKTEPAKMDFGRLHEQRDPAHFVPWTAHTAMLWVLAAGFGGLASYGLSVLLYKAGHKLNVKANADVRSSWALERNAIANEGIRDANERIAFALERLANKFTPPVKNDVVISLKGKFEPYKLCGGGVNWEECAKEVAMDTDKKLLKEGHAVVLERDTGHPFDPSGALTSAELKKIKATPGCDEMVYRDQNNVLQPEVCRP